MMKKNVLSFSAALALCVFFASCGKAKWESDFEKAKVSAAKRNKDIFLLFSGDDWAESSKPFKDNVILGGGFEKKFAKDFVFVNLDFSQTEFAKSKPADDASEAEKKLAQKIEDEYRAKELLARYFNVQSWPACYVVSQEGYVLSYIDMDPEKYASVSPDEFFAEVEKATENSADLKNAILSLRKSKGVERAKIIQQVLQNSSQEYSFLVKDLIYEFPSLDPENTTGLLGDYELQIAYFLSVENFEKGGDASVPFEEVAASENLTVAQKQEALYMAAYSLANYPSEKIDFERIKTLLQKSYSMDDSGEFAAEISSALENLSRYEEMVSQGQAD